MPLMEAGTTTIQITMPPMGESVTEGTILEWLKQVGDEVEADEGIVEVSTDKVDAEVPSPATGVLTKILVEPDETVPVGTVLGEISPNGAEPAAEPAADPADESAVEEAEHGADAEESRQEAKEQTEEAIVDVAVPEMGESVSEGTVLEWLGKGGGARGKQGAAGGGRTGPGAPPPRGPPRGPPRAKSRPAAPPPPSRGS